MDEQTVKPEVGEIFYDDYEMRAVHLFEKFSKTKSSPELLLQASDEISKSANPEAKQISTLYLAWYFREKGIKEKDNRKARKYLLQSLTEFKKIVPSDDVILKRVELEFLRRKFEETSKRPDLKFFLRRAALFKGLGQDHEYNQGMSLYYMFFLMENTIR